MGFGDERGRNLFELADAAQGLADQIFPDMYVVPGGSHREWGEQRERAAAAGPRILSKLAEDGLIDLEAVKRKYEGEQ